MSFERRKNKVYYYRKERDGKQVKSVYMGKNTPDNVFIQFDNLMRDKDEWTRRKTAMESRKITHRDDELDAIAELTESLATAFLLVAGFHQHKRQWRRKRK